MSTELTPTGTATARDPAGVEFVSRVAAAYDKAGLSAEEAWHVNQNFGLESLISDFIAESRQIDRYGDEEVSTTLGYASGYKKPKDVSWQADHFRELFPGIGFHDEGVASASLPKGAEGYFVIPRWQLIARTYGEAVQKVLELLAKACAGSFKNHCENMLGPDQLRRSAKSVVFWEKIGQEQKGSNLLVVPAQFGIRHRGRSVRLAREVIGSREFGLGAYEVGMMLLTHPERLQRGDDLWIDCAGDDYCDTEEFNVKFDYAPLFGFVDSKLLFDIDLSKNYSSTCSTASGFLVSMLSPVP